MLTDVYRCQTISAIMMITVIYVEEVTDQTTGSVSFQKLGEESHLHIEEVLLPSAPQENSPVFFTKKFIDRSEYRWQVVSVEGIEDNANTGSKKYIVSLRRKAQVQKEFYLKNIVLANRRPARGILFPWSIVEVEFGHSFTVGKICGNIRGSKRYVDTVQLYSMPKRRLAIVVQVIERYKEDLVQVIPITSKQPIENERRSSVEVTESLTKMVNYKKQSWAVCKMIQTVTASRIMAPLVNLDRHPIRDKQFRTRVTDGVRDALKDAMMFGVAADKRVRDSEDLIKEKNQKSQLIVENDQLSQKLQNITRKYENLIKFYSITQSDLDEIPET